MGWLLVFISGQVNFSLAGRRGKKKKENVSSTAFLGSGTQSTHFKEEADEIYRSRKVYRTFIHACDT